jgi:hypothetical protein
VPGGYGWSPTHSRPSAFPAGAALHAPKPTLPAHHPYVRRRVASALKRVAPGSTGVRAIAVISLEREKGLTVLNGRSVSWAVASNVPAECSRLPAAAAFKALLNRFSMPGFVATAAKRSENRSKLAVWRDVEHGEICRLLPRHDIGDAVFRPKCRLRDQMQWSVTRTGAKLSV